MPRIPHNPADLPTEQEPMDESLVHTGIVTKFVLADKADKNGDAYLQLAVKVTSEDGEGRTVPDNYIKVPKTINGTMDAAARKKALADGVRLGRVLAAMKITGGPEGFDTEDGIGREIQFTVKNEEYQGRMMPKVNDYLI